MYTRRTHRGRTLIHEARRFLGAVALATTAACADGPASVPPDAAGAGPRTTIDPGPYVAGQMYTGRNGYIEYYAGNSPLIISAPHGGQYRPDEIPVRDTIPTSCDANNITLLADMYTRETAMAIRSEVYARTGRYPHVIVNRVHRARMDPNRDMRSGACQDPQADTAWSEYHEFIEVARARVDADHGRGWYTDVHAHGHDIQRLELGYLLEGSDLRQYNTTLNASTAYEEESSIRTLSALTSVSFSRVLRGNAGLGTLLDAEGYPSVPSLSDPAPTTSEPYFNGGYSTNRHGCIDGVSRICGVQIEHYDLGDRDVYAAGFVRAVDTYLAQNFGFNLGTGKDDIMVDNDNGNNDTTRAKFSAASAWTAYTAVAGTHLNTMRLAAGAAATPDSASFAFYVNSAGAYKVYARWPSTTTATDSALYRVVYPGGTYVDVMANQQASGGQWTLLASNSSVQAGWGRVLILRDQSGSGTIAADAVRVVEQ
jgi:N-formylglutamate amidohydrolase